VDAVPQTRWLPIKQAWQEALYGSDGFYATAAPGDHFRTSSHVGPEFAQAIGHLADELRLDAICDVGAGSGELLSALAELRPGWDLLGVELRPRPGALPQHVGWQRALPSDRSGLIVANEWLDNVPCDVVERADDGSLRVVEVDPATGRERLGSTADLASRQWIDRWWPLSTSGDRAEVGVDREAALAALRTANPRATLLVIDFGHERSTRPARGSLTSYRNGRQLSARYDGLHDLTAGVAFDALAEATGATAVTQREAVLAAGLCASRPERRLAETDPARYLRRLATASRTAELIDPAGLGDFRWLVCRPQPCPSG
jgi:SAM-dependent MidA family methyltransferase